VGIFDSMAANNLVTKTRAKQNITDWNGTEQTGTEQNKKV